MQLKRLKKGDMVKVITGKDKGKTGKILKVISDKDQVVVEKLNIFKKHKRADQKGKGGIVEKEGPINISNVMFLCSKCDEGVRVGYKVLEDEAKTRVCKKCNDILDT
jgi:large subunit ribosomal protein L24